MIHDNEKWSVDLEGVLESIRINSLILSKYYKKEYLKNKSKLKYFRIPVIILSSFGSVFNFALSAYVSQEIVSNICCGMALITGLIGSVELFLQITNQMELDLDNSINLYLNAIDIYKVLNIARHNRNGNGLSYLNERMNIYTKIVTNSTVINKKLVDKLAPIDAIDAKIGSPIDFISYPNSRKPSDDHITIQV